MKATMKANSQHFTRFYITVSFQCAEKYKTKRNTKELQQIASNHSWDIEFTDFMKSNESYAKELFSFLVNDTTLPSDNP